MLLSLAYWLEILEKAQLSPEVHRARVQLPLDVSHNKVDCRVVVVSRNNLR
jgi:hypothetical protein